ncbi:MAG: sugar ABC transporter permease [Clostridium sp.]|jgi:arabinogalactan oligomer/maltooligosaccharide transport system permease protein|nr:sugar ABC transporter permease [Clostridium sp.]
MRKINKSAYVWIAPMIVSIIVFTLLPIAYTVFLSFTNYNMFHMDDYEVIGFANYAAVFGSSLAKVFLPVLGWTVCFALLSTAGAYFMGMGLAVLLNNPHMPEARFYRSLLIVPWALPATIAILSWQGLLNEQYGGINWLLSVFGLGGVPWMTDPFWARAGIIIVNVWLGFPYMLNVCHGGLQAIEKTLYEAAKIDGATGWQCFRTITFPLLVRLSLPLVVSSFASNFNNFGNIYMITQGGPARVGSQFAGSTDILASTIYKMTTWSNRYEWSATLSVLSFLLVGTFTLINLNLSGAFRSGET